MIRTESKDVQPKWKVFGGTQENLDKNNLGDLQEFE